MKTEDFISFVRREMLAKSLDRYSENLKMAGNHQQLDPIWGAICAGWDSMDDQQRLAMLKFVRLAMVETVSNIFSLLDNVGYLRSYGEFKLTHGPNNEKVNGSLLDYFMAAEEEDPYEVKVDPVE